MSYPENTSFTLNKGENGPHELTFELATANEALDFNKIVPYEVDFELWRETVETPLIAGIVTSINFESESEMLQVACKDWLHYLDRRIYPFDPMDPNHYVAGAPPRGSALEVVQEEVSSIVALLLNQTLAVPNSLDFFLDEMPDTGHKTDLTVSLFDTESIMSKIQQLSQQEPGIFDFWITWDRHFHMAVPRRFPIECLADATKCAWYFNDSASGLLHVNFTDTGPEGTYLIGYGSLVGSTDVQVGLAVQDFHNRFRRLDATRDFGDVTSRSRVDALTTAAYAQTANPTYEVVIEVYPDAIENFWNKIYPGSAIWLDYKHEARHIFSAHEVVSIECQVGNEVDESVTLNLNQVYPMPGETNLPPIPTDPASVPLPPQYGPFGFAIAG
jgi:hypothetical protein